MARLGWIALLQIVIVLSALQIVEPEPLLVLEKLRELKRDIIPERHANNIKNLTQTLTQIVPIPILAQGKNGTVDGKPCDTIDIKCKIRSILNLNSILDKPK